MYKFSRKSKIIAFILVVSLIIIYVTIFGRSGGSLSQSGFQNPVKLAGPDPWMIQDGDTYYYMTTVGFPNPNQNPLSIWKTKDPSIIPESSKVDVFIPPESGPYSKNLWAPELHKLGGKWYVYFTASPDTDLEAHSIWAIENPSRDPTTSNWSKTPKQVTRPEDVWAID